MIAVRTNEDLLNHLSTFEVDGASVGSLLFEGGRLTYPGRREIEYELGYAEPYTLHMEARVIEGLSKKVAASIRILSRFARTIPNDDWSEEIDPTLELLWIAHESWDRNGISADRLVAALVAVNFAMNNKQDSLIEEACETLIRGLHSCGFPPDRESLEELFDGAPPASVGLGLVDL